MQTSKLILLRALTLALVTIAHCGTASPESNSWWVHPGHDDAKTTTDILGSSPAAWQIPAGSITNVTVLGRPALRNTTSQPVILAGRTLYGTNIDYTATFRMDGGEGRGGGLTIQVGCKNPGSAGADPGAYVYAEPQMQYVQWQIYGINNRNLLGGFYPKAGGARSLAWPELLRKSVEKDLASVPDISKRWFTLRLVARLRSLETWLDGRLINIRQDPDLDLAGNVRLTLLPNTDLASFRATALPPEDPLHRPVALGHSLNASKINGSSVQRNSLPSPDSSATIQGVPFVFPRPDALGNDHISLAPSWAQFSALEGCFFANSGDFKGRWAGSTALNPARIQFRLPFDSYAKLHLITAADDSRNSVPVVTAQFYKTASGFPKSYSARVPLFTARSTGAKALPVKLENGRSGSLYLVTIPLDPGELSSFSDLDAVELELTKEVRLCRSYPDPIDVSYHAAGLPSSAHIYAMTLERSPISVDIQPGQYGHVWTSPVKPSYTVKLLNRTSDKRTVEIKLTTASHDGTETHSFPQTVVVPPGDAPTVAKFGIPDIKKFGWHAVKLEIKDGDLAWTENRSLAHLAPETREKGDWEDGRGPLLGCWQWGGSHETPSLAQELGVMAAAGAETCLGTFGRPDLEPEVRDIAEKNKMITSLLFNANCIHYTSFHLPPLNKLYDPAKPEESGAALVAELKKVESKPGPLVRPVEVPFFGEASIGPITYGNFPDYWGEPEYQLSPEEEVKYKKYLDLFLIGARAVRKEWPHAKLMLQYGDPLFSVPFLRRSKEVRELVDGVALDMPGYERRPEQQLHQVCHHRLYELTEEYRKIGKKPFLAVHEGTMVPTLPGACSWDEQADIYTRNFLIYFAYGVYRHPSGPTPFDCANYWGEDHNGALGLFCRKPHVNPKPSYAAYATLSRHLNRANFEKWIPTGSLSVYCLQFKHYNTGKLIHVLWTLCGRRPVTLSIPDAATVTRFDGDDNGTTLTPQDGKATFTISPSPCYVEGLAPDPRISLGEPDHSDSQPMKERAKLGNIGDGPWKLEAKRDTDYEENNPLEMSRALGKMTALPSDAPGPQGGKALAVRLEIQEKERKVMPWYTTLVPRRPVEIPGRSTHLGLWVNAASDWGRVVYVLRDDKNEKWISIGTKNQYNCDDTHCWSFFNFDGWRYLRFETPSNLGYDHFREKGSTWWGHVGPGDGIVDLPLKLEKIIVERRAHAIYVNDPQPTRPGDVLLADLYAEYETPRDMTDEAVRESRIRMPVPEGVPELGNPIHAMLETGAGGPTKLLRVENPVHQADGTQCHVFFEKVAGATQYDIWVSPYPDGTGALRLGEAWKEPGQLLTGLRPEMDFYMFVIYTDKDGKPSKPSAPLMFRLKDMFLEK